MKSAPSLTLSFFFLFAITTINFTPSFSEASEKVVDSQERPVSSAAKYYVLPFFSGPEGGGVTLGQAENSACPVAVLQTTDESDRGLAVKFGTGGNTSSGDIFTEKPLDVAFVDKPSCASSSNWVVVSDDFPGIWVGIGGEGDHPGKKVVTGKFIVQKFDVGYKLVFCFDSSSNCYGIGRHDDVQGRRLVLNNKPFEFSFNYGS